MKSLCFPAYPTPNPIVWKPLYIQTNQEPLSEIDGEAEHGRLDRLIYNTSFPSRHGKGHKGLPPGEHLGQLLSQACISSPHWCQIPNGHSKMLVICHLAAGGSALKCENTECTNNGSWPLTHFLKQTLISIAHIKWNTTTVANLGLMHGLYLKIDGASDLKKKGGQHVSGKNPHSIIWPARTAKTGCKKTACQYRKALKFHTFANWN